MFKSYIITAFRNLLKNKVFSFITILGLTGGLTSCFLIFTFVQDELSYDNFHEKGERIYRVNYFIQDFNLSSVAPIFAENIASYFPEVEKVSHFFQRGVSVKIADQSETGFKRFEEFRVTFADSSIFDIFSFKQIQGSLDNALVQPFTVVLDQETATKYFGNVDPIGKSIMMEGNHSFKVIAVVEDFPSNSHVHFNMLVPYENMYDLEPESLREVIKTNFQQNWVVSHSPTYVLFKEGADLEAANERFKEFVKEKVPASQQLDQSFAFQPLSDIHLNDEVLGQTESPGSLRLIYTFITVGLLTLFIACINFVNLSTARSLKRVREIGVRKALGAHKSNLMAQFLGESFLTTAIAVGCAIFLSVLLLPQMNLLTDKNLDQAIFAKPIVIAGIIILFIITSLLAGLYPSFYVTRFSTLLGLKGSVGNSQKGGLQFRKGLIIIQFTISMILISGTLIVFDQLNMMRNRPLGFNKNLMLTAPVQSQNLNNVFGGVDDNKRKKMNAFEEALAQIPSVKATTVSGSLPGFGSVNRNVVPEGFTAEDNLLVPTMAIDYDFLETFEMELVAGRDFSKEFGSDHTSSFIINEFAVGEYNFGSPEQALGKSINLEGKKGKVIGVVKDFNFLSLTEPMQSMLMEINIGQFSVFTFKIDNHNINETMAKIETVWNEFFTEETFDANFLDESLAETYDQQEQLGKVISFFSILAIIISCLGSYGLIMFIASQKMKEVGIRKVLGASVKSIVMLLAKRFVSLALVAIIIALPLILWLGNDWLDQFSYRISISPLILVVAGVLTLIMVLTTIAFQSFKAAYSNPVKALRTE